MSARVSELRRIMSTRPAAITVEDGARKVRRWDRASSGRVAFAHFALSGMALLIVVGTIGVVALRHVAQEEALRDARALTAALARGVIQPQISDAVLAGDPGALRRLDRLVHERVLGPPNPSQPKDSSIIRIKVWDTDGRIVYSDEPRLRGRRFVLPEDLREAMDARRASADVSDLSRPENRFERGKGRLVEVYQPMRVAAGTLVLLEAYHPAKDIKGASVRIEKSFLWVLLAFLAALALAQLPLAWFLARRVRADEQERERLRRAGDDALEGERRRIAAELHDGVVQDLAGVAYELQAAADRLPSKNGHDPDLGAALRRGAGVCRGSMRALRALLVDLYPSERREQGLDAAVEALARPLRERGVDVAVDMDLEGTLPSTTTELVYRAVQEALRNVDRHAKPTTIDVRVASDGETFSLTVENDGAGDGGSTRGSGLGLRLAALEALRYSGLVEFGSPDGDRWKVRLVVPVVDK